MITLNVPKEFEPSIKALAREKSQSVQDYFFTWLEDLTDLYEAKKELSNIKNGKSKLFSAANIRQELGLDNKLQS